jgi:hypothetical protein
LEELETPNLREGGELFSTGCSGGRLEAGQRTTGSFPGDAATVVCHYEAHSSPWSLLGPLSHIGRDLSCWTRGSNSLLWWDPWKDHSKDLEKREAKFICLWNISKLFSSFCGYNIQIKLILPQDKEGDM